MDAPLQGKLITVLEKSNANFSLLEADLARVVFWATVRCRARLVCGSRLAMSGSKNTKSFTLPACNVEVEEATMGGRWRYEHAIQRQKLVLKVPALKVTKTRQ